MSTPLETKTKTPRYMMFLRGSKRKILISIFSIAVILGIFLANFLSRKYAVPIIMYHQVLLNPKPEYRLGVSVKALKRQLHFLKRNHYNVVPLEELADLIKNKRKIPPRTIAITFDDGYKDNYTNAFQILKKYNFPVTIFVIVEEIDRPDRLSWDEIKMMQDSGFIVFGSHAQGPEPLINLKSEEELKKQIFYSKKILEEKLQHPVNTFSYPEGRFNSHIRQLVIDAGYQAAVTTNPGNIYPNDDIFALKRLRISENANNMLIFWFKTTGFYTFLKGHRSKR